MEAPKLPFYSPEKAAAPEPTTERRWKIFDVFKRDSFEQQPDTTEAKKPTTESNPEQHHEQRRRTVGKKIMDFLRGERREKVNETPQQTVEQATVSAKAPEVALQPPIVERAKAIGHNVLQLIKRITGEVQEADKQEQAPSPVDIEPLVEAETDVRSAMRELLAPVLAVEIPRAVFNSLAGDHKESPQETFDFAAEKTDMPATQSPDFEHSREFEQASSDGPSMPEQHPIILASRIAESVARAIVERHNAPTERNLKLKKVGIFALGAVTLGGFLHTWRRIREVKQEQRELRKEYKRFEAEVRQTQEAEAAKLRALEQTHVEDLSRRQRQHYVDEVSEFAHEQANEIREVAHMRQAEIMPVTPHAERRESAATAVLPYAKSEAQKLPEPQKYESFRPPEFVSHRVQKNAERAQAASEAKSGVLEHLIEKKTEALKKVQSGGGIAGGGRALGSTVMAAGTKVVSSLLGTKSTQPMQPGLQQSDDSAYVSPAQGWLFMCAIAAGTIALVLFVIGII